MSTNVTLTGNLAADPEITFGKNGTAIANMRVVTSRRIRKGEEWVDADTTFWRVKAFKKLAENTADSLHKGDAVVVVGRCLQEQWETAQGEKRESTIVLADNLALSLARYPARSTKHTALAPTVDPWETPATTTDMPF